MLSESGNSFIDRLGQRLKLPLPGTHAQWLMAASVNGNKSFDFGYKNSPVESSVLIMLFRRNDSYFFPLIQRPDYGGIHGGQMGLPGGKQEPEDKNRIETALRETREEIGVETGAVEIIGQLSELYVRASNYNVFPVIGYYPELPDYIPDPHEVSEVIECELTQLIREGTVREKELTGRHGMRITAPYFDIQDRVVWGATAMILSEFKTILKEIY